MKKRKFWMKFILSLCVVVTLVSLNFKMFAIRSSANSFYQNTSIYTVGAPVTLDYSSLPQFGGSGERFSGSLASFNVYSAVYSEEFDQTAFSWYGSIHDFKTGSTDPLYSFYYSDNPSSRSNFIFEFLDSRRGTIEFSLNSPVLFLNFNDFYSNFNFTFVLGRLSDLYGNSLSSLDTFTVTYTYIFADYDGDSVSIKPITNTLTLSPTPDGTHVMLMNSDTLTSSQLAGVDTFSNSLDGNNYYILLNAHISIQGVAVGNVICDVPYVGSNYTPMRYLDYQTLVSSRMLGIFDADYIQDNVVFEDISWTGWLVNAVGGFLDFQIVPGLSFAGMLGLLVGMSLFIVFLKVFSGG